MRGDLAYDIEMERRRLLSSSDDSCDVLPLLTTELAAELVGANVPEIHLAITDGQFAYLKIFEYLRIDPQTFKRWLVSGEAAAYLERIRADDAKPFALKPTKLYRHFAGKSLLYVGISTSHLERFAQHKNRSSWFDRVTRITVKTYPDRASAKAAESKAIRTEKPIFNRNGGRPNA